MVIKLSLPALKCFLLKFAGYLSAGIILLALCCPVSASRVVSSDTTQLSAGVPVISEKQESSSHDQGSQTPALALNWMLAGFTAVDPKLVFESDSRIMSNGRLSWERIRLKGVTCDLEALTGFLECARENLNWDFNYRLLISSDANRGHLNFLVLDGFEVVIVANFAAVSFQPAPAPKSDRMQLAIVIDDLGRSLKNAARFAALPLPLTFAIFPKLRNSREVASYFTARHCDIILHVPMEPRDYPHQDPGPGALFMSMSEDQIEQEFIDDLEFLPGIIGVNNHMGSRLTADPQKMTLVMNVLKGRNLFFLDSRTIASSIAYRKATAAGIPALQRDVFLDNERDVAKIIEQFRVLVEIARIKKSAIGIGHPYPETLMALTRFSKIAESAGVEIVAVRKLLPYNGIAASQ